MVGMGTTMVVEGGVVVALPPPDEWLPDVPPLDFGADEPSGAGVALGMGVAVGVKSGTPGGIRDGICLTGCDSDAAAGRTVGCSNQSRPMAAKTAHPPSPTASTAAAPAHASQDFELLRCATAVPSS